MSFGDWNGELRVFCHLKSLVFMYAVLGWSDVKKLNRSGAVIAPCGHKRARGVCRLCPGIPWIVENRALYIIYNLIINFRFVSFLEIYKY
jgi:hypothetical protein